VRAAIFFFHDGFRHHLPIGSPHTATLRRHSVSAADRPSSAAGGAGEPLNPGKPLCLTGLL
jgi:hypothetical protein